MQTYDTVTEALEDLSARGYTASFNLQKDCLYCQEKAIRLNPDEFDIDELYRFEGNTDPADEAIVYAISSTDGDIKGVLVNAYGAYGETASDELVSKLEVKRH